VAIPFATTTISVLRVPADPDRDPYDLQPDPATVAAGIRAHISTQAGEETVAGGSQQVTNHRLSCDPFDSGLHHKDQVVDDTSGETYEVVWSVSRYGVGMDHFQARLNQVSGVVSA
jgi:hypothetical protein